jgi:hypothetical protein
MKNSTRNGDASELSPAGAGLDCDISVRFAIDNLNWNSLYRKHGQPDNCPLGQSEWNAGSKRNPGNGRKG